MNLNQCRTAARKAVPYAAPALFLLLLGASRANAVPVVFNASETAQPGDVIYCQGAWGANATLRYQLITGSTTPAYSAATRMAVTTESSSSSDATPGAGYIAGRIPATEVSGLYAVWVSDGSGVSAVQYVNRAHGVQVECPAVAPGFKSRIFGRNLILGTFTPTVTYVDKASPYTSYSGAVTTSGSDGNVLWVTAPTGLTQNHTYNLIVNNGSAGVSGSSTVEADNPSQQGVTVQWAQETAVPTTTLNSGTVYWNLNVPWQSDYLGFCSRVFNVRTQYGATGNGTTNDAPAIQAAINAASNAGGGVVYLPTGTYRLDYYGSAPSNNILTLWSKVVLAGDGIGKSVVKFGYEAKPNSSGDGIAIQRPNSSTNGLINLELDNVETTSPGVYMIRPTDGNGNEFFIQNCAINAQTAQAVGIAGGGQYGLIANSVLTCTNEGESHTCFNGEANLTLYNNQYTYNMGRSFDGGVHDIIYDSNHITRSATSAGVPGHEAGTVDMWGDHVVFINNTFDVGNTATDITKDNDGEVLLTESDGGGARTHGSATAASSNTLTDSSQAFSANAFVPSYATGPWGNVYRYMIAIVSGPGTGQWRYVASNTATTVTVSQPWAFTPTAGSHYTILLWSANEWLVKNNTFKNNYRGMYYYSSSDNCVTVGNTFINDGGIHLWAAQNLGTSGPTNYVFHVQWDHQISNNSMTSAPGGFQNPWANEFWVNMGMIYPDDTIFGTAILGIEAHGNTLQAHTPHNVADYFNDGLPGERFTAQVTGNAGFPRHTPVDTATVGILGTVFQNNNAANQRLSDQYTDPNSHVTTTLPSAAYYIGTGTYDTTIADPINTNVGAEILDTVGTGAPGAVAAHPAWLSSIDYQWENGVLAGSVTSVGNDGTASGGAYVGGLNGTGSSCTLSNVDGGSGGTHTLTITYATPTQANEHLYVNGALVTGVSFPATGGWGGSASAWQTVSVGVNLNAGTTNTIKIQKDANDTPINLDKITVANTGHPANGWYRLTPASSLNSVLDVANGLSADQTPVREWTWNGTPSQQWYLTDSGNGWYRLTPGTNANSCLDVEGGNSSSGTPVWEYTYNGNAAQQWSFQPQSDGSNRLSTLLNPSQVLDVNGGTADGTPVVLEPWANTANQHWLLTPIGH